MEIMEGEASLGEGGLQWDDTDFTQWGTWFVADVLVDLAAGRVPGMASTSQPSMRTFPLNHRSGESVLGTNPGTLACRNSASWSREVALPGSWNCCLTITQGIGKCCSLPPAPPVFPVFPVPRTSCKTLSVRKGLVRSLHPESGPVMVIKTFGKWEGRRW